LSYLLLAIDYSKSFKYIGLVAARESVIKSNDFLNRSSWVKHIADLPKREKVAYLHRFPSRLARVRDYLERILVVSSIESANSAVTDLAPTTVLVDDTLYSHIQHPRKVRESRVKERHRRVLISLADNVAYYAYWVLEVRKRPRELERILK